ncbi:MAG TPA: hypothetical protein VFE64_14640 [Devosia sp.]|jgi:hypothetical protein|nr:hypothetical protein [Devosia sp.]
MAGPQQTILFTAMPRGITIDPARLPVSVLVSPRLSGSAKLGSFPDWLDWTGQVKSKGMKITFATGPKTYVADVDTGPLQPTLWNSIFDQSTLVDEYTFDDFSQRLILAYPNRATLTLMKSIVQIGGLRLALPRAGGDYRQGNREVLLTLLDGMAVNWNSDSGRGWRARLRDRQRSEAGRLAGGIAPASLNPFRIVPGGQAPFTAGELGGDGLPNATQLPPPGSNDGRALRSQLAQQFALYHHMPPAPSLVPPDMSSVIDFHKAITGLQSYPVLLRALGLVFDIDLPADFLPLTALTSFGTFGVVAAEPGGGWTIAPTKTPSALTAYDYVQLGAAHKLFLTAPRNGLNAPDPSGQVIGLLNLDPRDFGLAQVDIDGAMHKTIIVAESGGSAAPPLHPEVFDATATMPSLRSAGLALVSDARELSLLQDFQQATAFNNALSANQGQPRPYFAEDLGRGFRLDVWDSHSKAWHSLHRRDAVYTIGKETFTSRDEEGYVHLAVSGPAPGADPTQIGDFYLQEAIARWDGWSLSVPPVGKHLTRNPDPAKAVPPDNPNDPDFDPENPPSTPFKMTPAFTVTRGSLPSLRFGRTYRVRARSVDLAGNSLALGDRVTDALAVPFGAPRDLDGFAYLRYEPVAAPVIVLRDPAGVSGAGSAIDRLVIRTFNDSPEKDVAPADLTGSERHIVPPRISIELAERLAMFDDATGKLKGDAATYALIKTRDEGQFAQQAVPGQSQPMPIETAAQAQVPYLPDVLARGAALRDLPGTGNGMSGTADPGSSATPIVYSETADANPRPGSVTLVDFAAAADWTQARPFRIVCADGTAAPAWDAAGRALTVTLPKASATVVPLSCYVVPADLRLLGVWQWIREYFDALTRATPIPEDLWQGSDADALAHIIQRVTEGGHWMLTPPHLVTLVHAVQQPISVPTFVQLDVQHPSGQAGSSALMSEDMSGPTSEVALATLSGWRTLNASDAYLMGGLHVHGASTVKVDIVASWSDPVDDGVNPPGRTNQTTHADEIPLPGLNEGYLSVPTGANTSRAVGYYNPTHDLICFVRQGDVLSATLNGVSIFIDAAPRHHFNDTKHHRVSYTAIATSRFRDYFTPTLDPSNPNSPARDFTRKSAPVHVDIPASARPVAPKVLYVVPTFGWERQTSTNLKRSVRFGGGLRVYLDRPWYSSGDGELLGVVLYDEGFPIDREAWKGLVTQWGLDPIWDASFIPTVPGSWSFPLNVAAENGLSLDEPTPQGQQGKGRVSVAGHEVGFDGTYWYCDLTVETFEDSYSPFIRLALARYQPNALDDAKLSRVVLADFAQFLPDRSLLVTADPFHPGKLRVTVSGPVPLGPRPIYPDVPPIRPAPPSKPTQIVVTVQQRNSAISGDLGWQDVPAGTVTITVDTDGQFATERYLALWSGTVQFNAPPAQAQYRLMIRELEYVSADWTIMHPGGEALPPWAEAPGRLVYVETVELDATLIS